MAAFADVRVEATVPVDDLERARAFYGDKVGLQFVGSDTPGVDLVFEWGPGARLAVIERTVKGPPPSHTLAHFVVHDVAAAVHELRSRGVGFEDYDLPTLRTVDGVATIGDKHFAWFKDPEGNTLGVHD